MSYSHLCHVLTQRMRMAVSAPSKNAIFTAFNGQKIQLTLPGSPVCNSLLLKCPVREVDKLEQAYLSRFLLGELTQLMPISHHKQVLLIVSRLIQLIYIDNNDHIRKLLSEVFCEGAPDEISVHYDLSDTNNVKIIHLIRINQKIITIASLLSHSLLRDQHSPYGFTVQKIEISPRETVSDSTILLDNAMKFKFTPPREGTKLFILSDEHRAFRQLFLSAIKQGNFGEPMPQKLKTYFDENLLILLLLSNQQVVSAISLADILQTEPFFWNDKTQSYEQVTQCSNRQDYLQQLTQSFEPLKQMSEIWQSHYPHIQISPANLRTLLLVDNQAGLPTMLSALINTNEPPRVLNATNSEGIPEQPINLRNTYIRSRDNLLIITYQVTLNGYTSKRGNYTDFSTPVTLYFSFSFINTGLMIRLSHCNITQQLFTKLESNEQNEFIKLLKICQSKIKDRVLDRQTSGQTFTRLLKGILGSFYPVYSQLYGQVFNSDALRYRSYTWQHYFETHPFSVSVKNFTPAQLIIAEEDPNEVDNIIVNLEKNLDVVIKKLSCKQSHSTVVKKLLDNDCAYIRFYQFFTILNKLAPYQYCYQGENAFDTLRIIYTLATAPNVIHVTYSLLFDGYDDPETRSGRRLSQWAKVEVDCTLRLTVPTNTITTEFLQLRLYCLPIDLPKIAFLTDYFVARDCRASIIDTHKSLSVYENTAKPTVFPSNAGTVAAHQSDLHFLKSW